MGQMLCAVVASCLALIALEGCKQRDFNSGTTTQSDSSAPLPAAASNGGIPKFDVNDISVLFPAGDARPSSFDAKDKTFGHLLRLDGSEGPTGTNVLQGAHAILSQDMLTLILKTADEKFRLGEQGKDVKDSFFNIELARQTKNWAIVSMRADPCTDANAVLTPLGVTQPWGCAQLWLLRAKAQNCAARAERNT